MSDDNAFALALLNSPEAVRLNIEVAELRQERDRLRQRVADLANAQAELTRAEEALTAKVSEGALLIKSMLSSMSM